jgi:hypothetical protein
MMTYADVCCRMQVVTFNSKSYPSKVSLQHVEQELTFADIC